MLKIYRGPDTRHTVDNLEFSVEYTFRVCPVRITETDELFGSYSPILRHQIVKPIDTNTSNALHNQSANIELMDTSSSSLSATRSTTGAVKRIFGRITSICSCRKRLNDQEKAVMIVLFFMVITVIFAALIKTVFR